MHTILALALTGIQGNIHVASIRINKFPISSIKSQLIIGNLVNMLKLFLMDLALNQYLKIVVHFLFISLLCLAALTSTSIAGQIHKWTDENGKVHFGDRPPDDQQTEVIKKRTESLKPKSVDNSTNRIRAKLDAIEKEKEDKRLEKEQADNQQKKNLEYCAKLKKQMTLFEGGGRIYLEEKTGERRYFSSKEIDENRMKFKKLYQEKCT